MASRRTGRDKTALDQAIAACRPALGSIVLFSFFINLLMFVGPMYMLQIYDRVLSSRNELTLLVLTVIAGGLLVVYAVLEMVRSRILVRTGAKFDEALGQNVFDAVFKGALRLPRAPDGQSLRDMDTIREMITGSAIIAFCDAPWIPVFLAGCFLIHPWLGLVALGGAVVIFTLALANEVATRKKLMEGTRQSIAANSYAASALKNAEVVHAMGMMSAIRNRWIARHLDVLGWQALASDRAGSILAVSKFVRMFLQVAILGAGAYLALHGEITPGAMIAASIIMQRALAPVELGVGNWKNLVGARSAFERLQNLLRAIPRDPERMPLPEPQGALSVENIIATPPGGKAAVLRGITFALAPGESLGVIGPSAAGKSSLARVIVGVWPIVAGTARIDGAEIGHWDPEQLGRHVGYLPQDVELFAGTVAENIARFNEIDHEAVIKAARAAGVHDIIQNLPNGYDTEIGDAGQVLSGGQRQRVGLARALYGDPCLVILDEPNSSLDAAGEEALAQALKGLKAEGRTLIVITHRPNVLANTDKILVMNNGTMQKFGPRDAVLQELVGPKVVPARAEGAARGLEAAGGN